MHWAALFSVYCIAFLSTPGYGVLEHESDITCHLPSRRDTEWRYVDNGVRWWMVALDSTKLLRHIWLWRLQSAVSAVTSACCAVMQLQFYGSFVSPAGATQRRPPAGAGWPGAEWWWVYSNQAECQYTALCSRQPVSRSRPTPELGFA